MDSPSAALLLKISGEQAWRQRSLQALHLLSLPRCSYYSVLAAPIQSGRAKFLQIPFWDVERR
jgi:hypothetical protein